MAVDHGLEGKTVLITGAAGGIGQALARAFAAQGVRLMLLDRTGTGLSLVASELGATAVECDLGDTQQVAAVADQVRDAWGQLDVLVNNAGTEYPTPLDDAAPDAMTRWAGLLDNNVTSMVRLMQALLPLLPRGASVINQSSIWGRIGVAGFSAYAASKHAVIGLTRSLALELGPRGIRVNAVCPGWIRTEAAMRSLTAMAHEQGRSEAEVEREILARQAVPEMLTPADIAGVFLFLASTESRSLTGQCLVASHGEVMA
ncbi:NAD dependent epimerase/dehydratase family protein [Hydrogenophaga sp. RAC07]|uniref:SDR family NAD(P)-dependent oxidoreductase n=1 Tax=Hydrogenophaga sp. RAC07 TaxID=1842537 RepID=UPI00083D202F|nr:SDR family oxidoreductase [Hydrogenophaga sp. RAC07]AOF84849.1 NAD dependent epimerase/dehydratase family protein [Hydrogenophaga sp. RAC07]